MSNEPVSPLPTANASFLANAQTFWRDELPAIQHRLGLGGFIASGGLHGTAASKTSSAFATEAFTEQGDRLTADGAGGSVAIPYGTYGAADTDTAWVIISDQDTSPLGNFVRVGTSNYFVNVIDTIQPTLPADSCWLMHVTITSSAITAVKDLRVPASYVRCGVYDVHDPLYGAVGDGSTNDAAAINLAVAGARPQSILWFPGPLSFTLLEPVTLTKALTVVGNGCTITTDHNHAFDLAAPVDISGFSFQSLATGNFADVAIYSRQPFGAAASLNGTQIHHNIFGRTICAIADDAALDSTPAMRGIWFYHNTYTGDYTGIIAGHGNDLCYIEGFTDVYVVHNRFDVSQVECMLKLTASDRRVHVLGNSFRCTSTSIGKQCIDMYADTQEVIVANNTFDLTGNFTEFIEEKNGDNSSDYSEPSEIIIAQNICKMDTTNTAAVGMGFFGAWGLAEQTLTRSTCRVMGNTLLMTLRAASVVQAPIEVRGFTHGQVIGNVIWRDISVTAPGYTYGVEVSNCREILISGNQIEYGVVLVSGSASHPQGGSLYALQPEHVVITGNTVKSYKNLGSVFLFTVSITDCLISDNIIHDSGAGSGSGGFLYYTGGGTVDKLLMHGNAGAFDSTLDLTIGGGSAITARLIAGNSWQRGVFTWNPGTITNGTSSLETVNVVGALIGDSVVVGAPYSSQGALIEGRVSATGSVRVTIWNSTGGNLTFASGTWTVQTSHV